MKFRDIYRYLEGIPYIRPKQAENLYKFILDKKPSECLELGFAHGSSSCYIAAALDELGKGRLTTVDLVSNLDLGKPSIEELLLETGLQKYITVVREKTSYNWFLKKKIEQNISNEPIYDFCYIDGAKHWTIDGFAFFLVDKLLKEDGWILFDDLKWTYGLTKESHSDGINLMQMGQDELNTPHVELIFKLLVMQHPNYSEFHIQDDWWAWAHKVKSQTQKLFYSETLTFQTAMIRFLRNLLRWLRRRY